MTITPLRYLPVSAKPEAIMAVVGLVSDTHFPDRCRQLPPALFEVLNGVDLVLHAGDVGSLSVLDRLSQIAPVVAVHGNDESEEAQRELPYHQIVPIADRRIFLWHSHYQDATEESASRAGEEMIPKLERTIAAAQRAGAALAVFGHWHIPLVFRQNGVTVVNPGAIASGNEFTRQLVQTTSLLFLASDGAHYVAHINLAEPDRIFDPQVDITAGFAAAANRYSASILTPELRAAVPRLRAAVTPAEFQNVRATVAELAHRCWAGELSILDRDLVWESLQQSAAISEELRLKLQVLMDEAS